MARCRMQWCARNADNACGAAYCKLRETLWRLHAATHPLPPKHAPTQLAGPWAHPLSPPLAGRAQV